MNNKADDITIEEVHTQHLSYEHLLVKQNKSFEHQVSQATFVQGPGNFNNKPKGGNFDGNFGGNFVSNRGRDIGYYSNRGYGIGFKRNNNSNIQCHFCLKMVHITSSYFSLKNLIGRNLDRSVTNTMNNLAINIKNHIMLHISMVMKEVLHNRCLIVVPLVT